MCLIITVWSHCMVTAKSLGLPHMNAYIDSLGTNFTHGANFATYASTIGLPTSITPAGTFSPFYLYVQYSQFLQFRSHLLRQKGKAGQWVNTSLIRNIMYLLRIEGAYYNKHLYYQIHFCFILGLWLSCRRKYMQI